MSKKEKKTAEKKEFNYEYLFLLFAVIIFVDRLSKTFLKNSCFMQFCIDRTTNDGAAFGILPGMTWLFIAVAITALILIVLFIDEVNKTAKIALVLIASGTMANLIDRIFFSYVIDLFSVFGSSSFNIADICNTIGGIMLVISLLKKK